MKRIDELFRNNREWAKGISENDPEFFPRLSRQQAPRHLWVGCSDSRVPANEIVGLPPGELFVHRNVANIVSHSDLNFLAVLQYAIEVLDVDHIIICGHYGCGGIGTALQNENHGLIDNWLRPIKEVYERNEDAILQRSTEEQENYLCELNILRQVENLTRTTFVQQAWAQKKKLAVHGWVYDIQDGILKDLKVTSPSRADAPEIYHVGSK